MFINLSKKNYIILMLILIGIIGCVIGVIFKDNLFDLNTVENIQDVLSYYAEYDMTVISNKNINTYFVKEWYVKNIGSKFEYLDYMKNRITIIVKQNKCYIKNSGNKAYLITKNLYNNKNVASLSFFIDMYNTKCECKKNSVIRKDKKIYTIKPYSNCNCYINSLSQDLNINMFELITKSSPITYIIYSKEKEYMSILYRNVEINKKINVSEFNIVQGE